MAEGALSGEVKSYSVFKGVGFIHNEPGQPDIFLHIANVTDGTTPKAGDTLTFDLEPADAGVKGQMKAVNVGGGTGFPLTEEQRSTKGPKGKGGAGKGGGFGGFGGFGAAKGGKGGWGADPYGFGGFGKGMMGMGMGYDAFGGFGGGKGFGSGKGAGKDTGSQIEQQRVDRNAPQGSLSGTVKSYSVFKAFGFIHADPGEPDIFLHVRNVVDGTTPKAGDEVTFDLEPAEEGMSGQQKAVNVRGGTGYPMTEEQRGERAAKGGGGKGAGGKGFGGFGGDAFGAWGGCFGGKGWGKGGW